MEFIKNGKEFDIVVDGEKVGRMYKDESRNHMFQVVAEFNLELKGYRNSTSGKTFKAVKVDAERMYNNLLDINERTQGKFLL